VTHLNLENNEFSRFPVAFVTMPNLQFINISNNKYESLSEEELKRFPSSLQVTITNNPLNEESVQLAKKYKFIVL
jgi:Leucine-rich repeat (LRR) protein